MIFGSITLDRYGHLAWSAEGEGFEPPGRLTAPNGFQDRRIRPLCHPSGALR
jgi:hypothetical protein